MKIAIEHLRESIRKILLENANDYQKIITMLESKELMNIRQAVEIGESIGYFEIEKKIDNNPTWWNCDFYVPEEFYEMFVSKYPDGVSIYKGGISNPYGTNEIGYIHPAERENNRWSKPMIQISWPKDINQF